MVRVPPQDVDSEMCVIGACLDDWRVLDAVADALKGGAEDFYREAHGIIFASIRHLRDNREPVDPITVSHELRRRNQLDRVGGAAYLTECIEACPTSANGPWYAEKVRDAAIRRRLIDTLRVAAEKAYSADTATQAMDAAMGMVRDLLEQQSRGTGGSTFRELATAYFEELDKGPVLLRPGMSVKTGFPAYDAVYGGLRRCLTYLAGRPGMGKTSLMRKACLLQAKAGIPVAAFSMEFPKEEFIEPLVAEIGHVSTKVLQLGPLEDLVKAASGVLQGITKVGDLPLYIFDGVRTLAEIRNIAGQLQIRYGIRALWIDRFEIIRQEWHKGENEQSYLTRISGGLRDMAMDLKLPVVCLMQFSREVEKRAGKKPLMSDLRGTGSAEQDAKTIWTLFRPEYYEIIEDLEGNKYPQHYTEWAVAKQSLGPCGVFPLRFVKDFPSFEEMDLHHEAPKEWQHEKEDDF